MNKKRFFGFPSIDLESAINKVKTLHEKEGGNSVNIKIASTHWGYSEKSSGGRQTTSALKIFGLIEDSGRTDSRKIQISKLGLRIILDEREDSSERDNAVKIVALKPKIFEELWKEWKDTGLPSDANISHFLIFEKGINDKRAKNFVKIFKDTVTFANLSSSDPVSEENEGDEVITDSPKPEASSTGSQSDVYLKIPAEEKTEIRQDLFSLSEGQVIIRLPKVLSRDSYQDLKGWIDLILRNVERSIVDNNQTQKKPETNDNNDANSD